MTSVSWSRLLPRPCPDGLWREPGRQTPGRSPALEQHLSSEIQAATDLGAGSSRPVADVHGRCFSDMLLTPSTKQR
jgi:hypothetical protein